VFRGGVAMVRVDAQVVDGHRVLGNLTQEDFAVYDEGRPQKTEYFGRESDRVDLLLLLDVSGSMHRYLEQMAAVAREALEQLREGDRVSVMLFARRTQVREPFTEDFKEIAREIGEAVHESGLGSGTAINAAVTDAASYAGSQPPRGRRAVLILTDNLGLNYQLPDEVVVRALSEADCVLNAMVAGKGERPKPPRPGQRLNPDFTPSDVFRLAEETGGEAVKADRVDTTFRQTVERLRTRYSMHYRAPESPAGAFHRIRVELAPEARRRYPRALIRTRSGYYAK